MHDPCKTPLDTSYGLLGAKVEARVARVRVKGREEKDHWTSRVPSEVSSGPSRAEGFANLNVKKVGCQKTADGVYHWLAK